MKYDDVVNTKIIKILMKNPEYSQKQIADEIGMAQPSISCRLDFLIRNNVIKFVRSVRINNDVLKEIEEKDRIMKIRGVQFDTNTTAK